MTNSEQRRSANFSPYRNTNKCLFYHVLGEQERKEQQRVKKTSHTLAIHFVIYWDTTEN